MGGEIFWAAFGGGAAAGVIVIAADWFRWHLDRPLLKVGLSLGNKVSNQSIITSPIPNMANDPLLLFFARNNRFRPVFIVSFGLEYSDPKSGFQFWRSDRRAMTGDWFQLPYEVTDGKGFLGPWPITRWFESLRESGLEPRHLKRCGFCLTQEQRFRRESTIAPANFYNPSSCLISDNYFCRVATD